MARRRGGFSRPLGRGARLRKSWCRANSGAVGVALTTTQQALMSCTILEGSIGDGTVLRTRGDYMLIGTPDAATDSDIVGLGICVVNASALAIGGTSLPGPIADIDSDVWLWHAMIPIDAGNDTAREFEGLGAYTFRGVIDSKGMRKIAPDQAVVVIGELATGTLAGISYFGGVQFLFGI